MGLALLAAAVLAQPAAARKIARFDVPAGRLAQGVVAIGTQAGVTVGLVDQQLGQLRVPALRGEMTVESALARLLADTPAVAVRIDDVTYRIVRRRTSSSRPVREQAPTAPPVELDEVVVRGSKRNMLLTGYPGGVVVYDPERLPPGAAAQGSDALVASLPILASTHLGSGRDKLFIRGIADSSFTGVNQATVGQYLGDVRLNFSAPDPDLSLHDLRSVEVLEGPQGTLYGAGALGGIVRLEPEPPDLARFGGSLAAGITTQAHGDTGSEFTGVLNLPIVHDRLGLRAVGYRTIEGGDIDDTQRGLRDVNRTTIGGGRVTLRYAPGRWTISLGGVMQDINSRDGQYAERGRPALTRASLIAQPFDNDYRLASLVVRGPIGGLQLTSATSLVRHDLTFDYDASLTPAIPLRFRQHERIKLLTSETRLAGNGARLDWVVGLELLRNDARVDRQYGPAAAPMPIQGVRNEVDEASLFGELNVRVARRVTLTVGGRAVTAHRDDETFDAPGSGSNPSRTDHAFLPSVGLLWSSGGGWTVYGRYQEGFRSGGLAATQTSAERFRSDRIRTIEGGVRYRATDRLVANAGVSLADWRNIQADLVTGTGFPTTANVGDGRVYGFEASLRWRPVDPLVLEAAVFANDSALYAPATGFGNDRDSPLPNIADQVARIGGSYTRTFGGRALTLNAAARYVGRSRLGVGPALDLRQGGFIDTEAGATFATGRLSLALSVTNLFDTRGNRFSFGNPFQVAAGRETTPLQPRAIRLGISRSF